jgi:hypothetical protein
LAAGLFQQFQKAVGVRGRFAEFKSSWNRSLSGAPTSAGEVHVVPLPLPPSGLRVGICVNDRRCGFGFFDCPWRGALIAVLVAGYSQLRVDV